LEQNTSNIRQGLFKVDPHIKFSLSGFSSVVKKPKHMKCLSSTGDFWKLYVTP